MKLKAHEILNKYSKELWFCFRVCSWVVFPLWVLIDTNFGALEKITGLHNPYDEAWYWSMALRLVFSCLLVVNVLFLYGVSTEAELSLKKLTKVILFIIFVIAFLVWRDGMIEDHNWDLYFNDRDDDCSDYIGNDIWIGSGDPDGIDRDGDGYGCESYGG